MLSDMNKHDYLSMAKYIRHCVLNRNTILKSNMKKQLKENQTREHIIELSTELVKLCKKL